MKEIQLLSLLCIVMAAVLSDLKDGRIPNGLIATGLLWGAAYQIFGYGIAGAAIYLGGMILPVLLFGGFFYFRMIGAGDVKLLCVVGGYLGPSTCFACIAVSVLSGAVISLVIMLRRRSLGRRLLCFSDYLNNYARERQWKSYLAETEKEARFCFSIPVLLGILCYAGGII